MAHSGPFLSSPDLDSSLDSSGSVKYTSATGEILTQTRGRAIFRIVLWLLVGFIVLGVSLVNRVPVGVLLYTGLLVVEAVILIIFAVWVGQFRRMGVASNMAGVARSLKYFWIINCVGAVMMLVEAVIDIVQAVM